MVGTPTFSRKSRHCRDQSDTLLSYYSSTMSLSQRSSPGQSDPPNETTSFSPMNYGGGGYYGNPLSPLKQSLSFFKGGEVSPSPTNQDNVDAPPQNGGDVPQQQHQQQQQQQPPTPSAKKKKKKAGYRVHRVSYTAQNHVQVLFRTYASAFPQVFPFMCANVVWTLWLYSLKIYNIIDLTFHSSVGHSFMGLLVSFLIVSRSKISYGRFMNYRNQLANCYKACREIAQYTTVYTFQTQTEEAAWWRQEVCYRTILLLRVTMDALLWSSTNREHWEDEYYKFDPEKDGCDGKEKEEFRRTVSRHFYHMKKLSHGRRSFIDENFRSPVTNAHLLRQVMMEHPQYLGYKMAVNEYRDLLHFVENFMSAFHVFRVLIFTPYPFPLVQMTRAFLFFWVYTLPMVLLKDYRLWTSILIVVSVSLGFIGIEYVSMALDDPFGDDTNDVDEHGMSLLVYEDMYLAIYRTDGADAAMNLRDRVLERYRKGRELDCYRDDLKGYDVWEARERWFDQQQEDEESVMAQVATHPTIN